MRRKFVAVGLLDARESLVAEGLQRQPRRPVVGRAELAPIPGVENDAGRFDVLTRQFVLLLVDRAVVETEPGPVRAPSPAGWVSASADGRHRRPWRQDARAASVRDTERRSRTPARSPHSPPRRPRRARRLHVPLQPGEILFQQRPQPRDHPLKPPPARSRDSRAASRWAPGAYSSAPPRPVRCGS